MAVSPVEGKSGEPEEPVTILAWRSVTSAYPARCTAAPPSMLQCRNAELRSTQREESDASSPAICASCGEWHAFSLVVTRMQHAHTLG
jgi:hypothetical protein